MQDWTKRDREQRERLERMSPGGARRRRRCAQCDGEGRRGEGSAGALGHRSDPQGADSRGPYGRTSDSSGRKDLPVADQINARTAEIIAAFGERVLPITKEIADLWGVLLGESEKHIDDTGIAATARVHGLMVVTRNLDDFAGRAVATLDPFKKPPKINTP